MILIFKFIQPTTDNTSKQVFNFSLPSSSSFVVYTTNHNFLIHLHLLKRFFISHLFHQTRKNSFSILPFLINFSPSFSFDRLKHLSLRPSQEATLEDQSSFPHRFRPFRHIEEILATLPSSSFLSYLLFSQINSYILQEE